MRLTAKIISVLFHPIFILFYVFMLLHIITPAEFIFTNSRQNTALHLLVFGLSVFFPLVSTGAFRSIGLISSFRMQDKQERIGPMIATIIFYVWLFMNYRSFGVGPAIFTSVILGSGISLAIAFLINNFSKISLHTVGMGGLVGAVGVFRFVVPANSYNWYFDENYLAISPNWLLAAVIILAGVVGTCRLILDAHRQEDMYGGYLVGFLSQIIAYRLIGPF